MEFHKLPSIINKIAIAQNYFLLQNFIAREEKKNEATVKSACKPLFFSKMFCCKYQTIVKKKQLFYLP